MTGHDWNALFDQTILADSTLPVVRTAEFPASEIPVKEKAPNLVYHTGVKYYRLPVILDDKDYPDTLKIAWIKDALNDTSQDAFEYLNAEPVLFFQQSAEARRLLEGYFKRKNFEAIENGLDNYRPLIFKLLNNYPESETAIDHYFNTRKQNRSRCFNECFFIETLLHLGREEKALKYLTVQVQEFCAAPAEYHPRITEAEFEPLCFSANPTIARNATDLLFQYMEKEKRLLFFKLPPYLDRSRFQQILLQWFDYYAQLDFRLDDVTAINEYRWFMSMGAPYLGERIGKKLWREFMRRKAFWQLETGAPAESPLSMAEYAFQDPTLSPADKRSILLEVPLDSRVLEGTDSRGVFKNRYLNLINSAFPNLKISRNDFDQLSLQSLYPYSFPWQIPAGDLEVRPFQPAMTVEKTDAVLAGLQRFAQKTGLTAIQPTALERYRYAQKSAEACLLDFLGSNQKIAYYDAESSDIPANYIDFFETEFKPVLSQAGIRDLRISQKTTRTEDGQYHYQIYVKCNESIYTLGYTARDTDWYLSQRLVKMINCCLIDKKVPIRLVEADSGDQMALFFLMEPAVIRPLLDQFGLRSRAVHYGDAFQQGGL